MPDAPEVDALTEALADPTDLGSYQGQPIIRAKIKVTKAGDGLSKALKIEPTMLPVGWTGMLLLEVECVKHGHQRITDTEAFEVELVLAAGTATIVDDKSSRTKIERQRRKIEKAVDKAHGRQRLSDADPEFDEDADLPPEDADE